MSHLTPDPIGDDGARGERPARGCDHPDCEADGIHRAPRSRNALNSYYWFCLEHVRSYNAAWNFFAGMNRSEIEAYQHADLTWHRPTWPLGRRTRLNGTWSGNAFNDPYGMFGPYAADEGGAAEGARRCAPAGEREALAVMNLSPSSSTSEIKARYKELVKRLHPDVNGGDTQAEDQLKVVIEAYRVLSRHPCA